MVRRNGQWAGWWSFGVAAALLCGGVARAQDDEVQRRVTYYEGAIVTVDGMLAKTSDPAQQARLESYKAGLQQALDASRAGDEAAPRQATASLKTQRAEWNRTRTPNGGSSTATVEGPRGTTTVESTSEAHRTAPGRVEWSNEQTVTEARRARGDARGHGLQPAGPRRADVGPRGRGHDPRRQHLGQERLGRDDPGRGRQRDVHARRDHDRPQGGQRETHTTGEWTKTETSREHSSTTTGSDSKGHEWTTDREGSVTKNEDGSKTYSHETTVTGKDGQTASHVTEKTVSKNDDGSRSWTTDSTTTGPNGKSRERSTTGEAHKTENGVEWSADHEGTRRNGTTFSGTTTGKNERTAPGQREWSRQTTGSDGKGHTLDRTANGQTTRQNGQVTRTGQRSGTPRQARPAPRARGGRRGR